MKRNSSSAWLVFVVFGLIVVLLCSACLCGDKEGYDFNTPNVVDIPSMCVQACGNDQDCMAKCANYYNLKFTELQSNCGDYFVKGSPCSKFPDFKK